MKSICPLVLVALVIAPYVSAKVDDGGIFATFRFHNKNKTETDRAFVVVHKNATLDEFDPMLTKFNPDQPTKILIHGWRSNAQAEFPAEMVEIYVDNTDYNVITVDWSSEASAPYEDAVKTLPVVGLIVGEMIDALVTNHHALKKDIHLIGHSLGAHVAGIAGLNVIGGKIDRVTGLDPARPNISLKNTRGRLSKESAEFVDVIHTCSDILSFPQKLGHLDFYPNNGIAPQPGCGLDDVLKGGPCSHFRSYKFYAESITNPKAFPARHCGSFITYNLGICWNRPVAYMGETASPSSSNGAYFLKTNKESPFGKGVMGL